MYSVTLISTYYISRSLIIQFLNYHFLRYQMVHLISNPRRRYNQRKLQYQRLLLKGENEKIYQPRGALINIVVGKELARN